MTSRQWWEISYLILHPLTFASLCFLMRSCRVSRSRKPQSYDGQSQSISASTGDEPPMPCYWPSNTLWYTSPSTWTADLLFDSFKENEQKGDALE